METIGTWWLWSGFTATVIAMIAIDLTVVGAGRQHRVSLKEAALWSVVWVAAAMAFAGVLWWHLEGTAGAAIANARTLEFVTGYVIEKTLAIDNVFVWLMVFSFFAIPIELQRRVLLYGVVGAIVLRTVLILAGSWLLAEFHWLLYVFGAFLLITGIKMWRYAETKPNLAHNPVVKWLRRRMKLTEHLEGERFFVTRSESNGVVRYATPLFLALVMVEVSDLIFAVDSIPAIFAITTDPFIVLTSNVFAILGLRAMYFLLAEMAERFSLLKYGLALVLVVVGLKMLLIDVYKFPISLALGLVATIIGVSIVLSLRRSNQTAVLNRDCPALEVRK